MAQTNPDGRTHTYTHAQRTHIHRTKIVTPISRSPQAGSTTYSPFEKEEGR